MSASLALVTTQKLQRMYNICISISDDVPSTLTSLPHPHVLCGQGGVLRFYRGIAPALLQGPLSRFGDTAANVGVLTLLDANDNTRDLPVSVKTLGASLGAAVWRIFLMPLDTVRNTVLLCIPS